jgi:hypothetical protein
MGIYESRQRGRIPGTDDHGSSRNSPAADGLNPSIGNHHRTRFNKGTADTVEQSREVDGLGPGLRMKGAGKSHQNECNLRHWKGSH